MARSSLAMGRLRVRVPSVHVIARSGDNMEHGWARESAGEGEERTGTSAEQGTQRFRKERRRAERSSPTSSPVFRSCYPPRSGADNIGAWMAARTAGEGEDETGTICEQGKQSSERNGGRRQSEVTPSSPVFRSNVIRPRSGADNIGAWMGSENPQAKAKNETGTICGARKRVFGTRCSQSFGRHMPVRIMHMMRYGAP